MEGKTIGTRGSGRAAPEQCLPHSSLAGSFWTNYLSPMDLTAPACKVPAKLTNQPRTSQCQSLCLVQRQQEEQLHLTAAGPPRS